MTNRFKSLLLAGAAAGLVGTPVYAQQAGASNPAVQAAGPAQSETESSALQGDEIVVTARKRAENLQDVPVSITAFSGDQLIKAGAQNFTDFAANNPNVKLGPTAGGGGLAIASTIRGNVNAASFLVVDPSVGIYVDDAIYAHTWGTMPLTVDVESVQTLKGPQGTLFGRNTTGGAMLIKTIDPNLDGVSGYVRGEVGTVGTSRISAAVNLPLGDKFAIRLATEHARMGNYETLSNGVELGEENRTLVRAKLLFEATPTTTIIAEAEVTREKVNGTINVASLQNGPVYDNVPVFTAGVVTQPSDPWTNRERKKYQAEFYGLRVIQDIGDNGTVKFVLGHREYDVLLRSTLPRILGPTSQDKPDNKETSMELQLNTSAFNGFMDIATGLFFYDEDLNDNQYTYDTARNIRAAGLNFVSATSNSKSGYIQATAHLSPKFNVTLGGRYTSDRKFAFALGSITGGVTMEQALAEAKSLAKPTYEASNRKFNYLISADFTPVDGIMFYASHSTGYRAGGPQVTRFSNVSTNPGFQRLQFFNPESIKNYEAGAKLELFDRLVTLNGAAFYQDYTDYQYTGNDPVTITRILFNVDATIKGFEVDGTLRLGSGTRLSANVGYTDARLAAGPSKGNKLPDVPTWTWGVTGSQHIDIGGGGIDLVASYSYLGDFSTNVSDPNVAGDEYRRGFTPGRGLLNLSATYETGPITLAVFATNLTDKKYYTHVRDISDGLVSFAMLGKPRVVGVRAGYKF